MSLAPSQYKAVNQEIDFTQLSQILSYSGPTGQNADSVPFDELTKQIEQVSSRLNEAKKNLSFLFSDSLDKLKEGYTQEAIIREEKNNYDNLFEYQREDSLKRQREALKAFRDIDLNEGEYNSFKPLYEISLKIEEEKRQLKNKLPSLIASAIFIKGEDNPKQSKGRNFVEFHTGIIVLDFDKVENLDLCIEIVKGISFTRFLFVSPSGNGFKVFVQIDTTFENVNWWGDDSEHKAAYQQVIKSYESELDRAGVVADISCSNVNRICYLCYRPNHYSNPESQLFPIDQKEVKKYVARKKFTPRPKTDNLHDCDTAIQLATELITGRVEAGTLQKYEVARFPFCFQLSCEFNRYGVPLEDAITHFSTHYPITNERNFLSVRGAYESYKNEFCTKGIEENPEPEPDKPKKVSEYKTRIIQGINQATDKGQIYAIQANTGSGKTFATGARESATGYSGFAWDLLEQDKGGQIAFVSPTVILTEQTATDEKINIPFITGNVSKADRIKAANSPFFACTYNQSKQWIQPRIENTRLVVDEWHLLAESGYMDANGSDVCKNLFDLCRAAKSTTLLSATPPPLFDLLGVHYDYLELPHINDPKIEFRNYTGSQGQSQHIFSELENVDFSKGKIVIYMNGLKRAKSIRQRFENLLPEGKRLVLINSDERESSDYKHLIENRTFADDAGIILVTKLVEAGINIYNEDIQKVYFFDSQAKGRYPNPNDFKQFIARFRKLKEVNVIHYLQNRKGRKTADIRKLFKAELETAEGLVRAISGREKKYQLEHTESNYKALKQLKDDTKYYRRNSLTNEPEPDYLEIWRDAWKKHLSSLSHAQYVDELLRGNENFQIINSVEDCETYEPVKIEIDSELEVIEKDAKELEEKADSQLNEWLCMYPSTVYESVYHSAGDIGLKKQIRQHVGTAIRKEISEGANDLITANKWVFDNATFKPVKRFILLENAEFGQMEISDIFSVLSEDQRRYTEARINKRIANKANEIIKAENAKKRKGSEARIKRLKSELSKVVEETKSELETISKDRENNTIHFTDDRFYKFLSTLETLKLKELTRTKKGRETITDFRGIGEQGRYKGEKYNKFVRSFRNWKTRTYTRKQIEILYAQTDGKKKRRKKIEINPRVDGVGMIRFKELFEYETVMKSVNIYDKNGHIIGKKRESFYQITAAKSVLVFCHEFRFFFDGWIRRFSPIPSTQGDFSTTTKNPHRTTYNIDIVSGEKSNIQILTNFQTTDIEAVDYIPF